MEDKNKILLEQIARIQYSIPSHVEVSVNVEESSEVYLLGSATWVIDEMSLSHCYSAKVELDLSLSSTVVQN